MCTKARGGGADASDAGAQGVGSLRWGLKQQPAGALLPKHRAGALCAKARARPPRPRRPRPPLWRRRAGSPLRLLVCIRTFIVSSGWMVLWDAARAMAPATTSWAGLSGGGAGADADAPIVASGALIAVACGFAAGA